MVGDLSVSPHARFYCEAIANGGYTYAEVVDSHGQVSLTDDTVAAYEASRSPEDALTHVAREVLVPNLTRIGYAEVDRLLSHDNLANELRSGEFQFTHDGRVFDFHHAREIGPRDATVIERGLM